MKKISILIDSISNSGGTDRVAVNLSNLFVDKGNQVTIYTVNSGRAYYELSDSVSVVSFSRKSRLSNLFQIANDMKKREYDACIIISMGKLSTQALPLLRLFLWNTLLISSDHVAIDSFPWYIRILKYVAYMFADKVVVLTEYDRKRISQTIKERKVKSIRNMSSFCNVSNFIPNKNDHKIAIAVGRLTHQKNFLRLIKIWERAKIKNWKLCIIGDGEDSKELTEYCSMRGLNNIEFHSSSKSIDHWYKHSSLILMTSRYEGLPMVLIESKNFSLPAIAIHCKTGPDEIITDDGYVVESDDDFIEKLKSVTDNSNDCYDKLSSNAFKNSRQYNAESIYLLWNTIFSEGKK